MECTTAKATSNLAFGNNSLFSHLFEVKVKKCSISFYNGNFFALWIPFQRVQFHLIESKKVKNHDFKSFGWNKYQTTFISSKFLSNPESNTFYSWIHDAIVIYYVEFIAHNILMAKFQEIGFSSKNIWFSLRLSSIRVVLEIWKFMKKKESNKYFLFIAE